MLFLIKVQKEAVSIQYFEAVFLFLFFLGFFYDRIVIFLKTHMLLRIYAVFFLKLCAKACNPNSNSHLDIPRWVNLLKFLLDLICANTGSTSAVRCLRLISPISLKRFSLTLILCRSRL